MKSFLWSICFISGCILAGCSAGYVTKRPADRVYARPVTPGHGYVWVSGEWVWSSGKYHWHEGYWHTAKPGQTWKPGYWEDNPKGYKWHKGRWE